MREEESSKAWLRNNQKRSYTLTNSNTEYKK